MEILGRHARLAAEERKLLLGAIAVFVLGGTTGAWLVDEYGVRPDRVVVTGAAPNMSVPRRDAPVPTCRNFLLVGPE